jgi:hypothetical protein
MATKKKKLSNCWQWVVKVALKTRWTAMVPLEAEIVGQATIQALRYQTYYSVSWCVLLAWSRPQPMPSRRFLATFSMLDWDALRFPWGTSARFFGDGFLQEGVAPTAYIHGSLPCTSSTKSSSNKIRSKNTSSQMISFLHSFLPFHMFHHELTMMAVARSSTRHSFGRFIERQGRRALMGP